MEAFLESNTLEIWLSHYGSFALFVFLALGILALPLPEESLMILAGVLMHRGDLPIPQTVLASFLGSLCGITCSYLVGRTAGHFMILRYGKWMGIGQEHLDKAHVWFERFGKWALFIGYFIPGVRHFTGLSAGMSSLGFKDFAFFAYSGGLIWISTFLSIGYFLGNYWVSFFENFEFGDHIVTLCFVAAFILVGYFIHRRMIKK